MGADDVGVPVVCRGEHGNRGVGVATLYSYELAFLGASVVAFTAARLVAWWLVETYDAETRPVVVE